MKSPATQSFVLAVIAYSLLLLVGYWLWAYQPVNKEATHKAKPVPVTLAMFTEPASIIPPTPVVLPEPIIKPEIAVEPEPVVEPAPIVAPEPVIKAPTKRSTPTKKPIKKIINKPIKKPVKKQPVKSIKPKKIQKPIELTQPSIEVVKKTTDTPPISKTPAIIEPPEKPAYTQEQTDKAEQLYLLALRKQIMIYAQDTYPRRAKRRRWEGTVLIQFELTPDGLINKLKIAESSGRNILDKAALEIFKVKMNNHFKAFPNEINRERWSIKVPVSYNLL